MDTATQACFIILHLMVAASIFSRIGKSFDGTNQYRAMAWGAFIHGLFTIAFLLWWDTSDLPSMIGKIALLALMWLPWIYDLADIHNPPKPVTLKSATMSALICAARIGLVLGFWTLY